MIIDKPLDCDGFAAKLADYLEGDAPDAVRAAMEAHAVGCADCRQLFEDIDSIRHEAAALPALTPTRDLWAGIAERIDAPVIPLERTRRTIVTRRTWARPAIAAAALVVFTAGITHFATKWSMSDRVASGTTAPGQVATVTPTPAPDSVEPSSTNVDTNGTTTVAITDPRATSSQAVPTRSTGSRAAAVRREPETSQPERIHLASGENVMRTTEPVYDREIEKLRRIVKTRRTQLDPKTITVLEQSIAVIDSAIAQSRAALAKDPASGFLATQLNHSLEKKVELLRTAAMLPART
jgi:anti-sigma factor RsiW